MQVKELTLNDTVELMNSPDYKERFCAEYIQTKIRYERLKAFNTRIEAARETKGSEKAVPMPEHDCPDDMLIEQQHTMGKYLHLLEVRAVIEGIDLDVAMRHCAMLADKESGYCQAVKKEG